MGVGDIIDSFKQVIADDVASAITTARVLSPKASAGFRTLGLWNEHDPDRHSTGEVTRRMGNTALNAASFVPFLGVAKAAKVGARASKIALASSVPKTAGHVVKLAKTQTKLSKTKKAYKAGKNSADPAWGKKLKLGDSPAKHPMKPGMPRGIPQNFKPEFYLRPHLEEGFLRVKGRQAVRTARAERNAAAGLVLKDVKNIGKAGKKAIKAIPRKAKKARKYLVPGIAGQGTDVAFDRNKQDVATKSFDEAEQLKRKYRR